jgi:NADPH:quinone reductase-like Zn-dependent oxidoreductase
VNASPSLPPARGADVHGRRDGAADPQGPQAGGEARRELLVSVHAGQRRAAARAGLLYDAGHLRPLIDKTFPFDQTLEALAYVEQGRANGKVVITLD